MSSKQKFTVTAETGSPLNLTGSAAISIAPFAGPPYHRLPSSPTALLSPRSAVTAQASSLSNATVTAFDEIVSWPAVPPPVTRSSAEIVYSPFTYLGTPVPAS